MEARRHGGQHWDDQDGEDDYGKTLQLSSYKSGASSLSLLVLAWQVGSVHRVGERLQKRTGRQVAVLFSGSEQVAPGMTPD